MHPALEVHNLTVTYHRKPVLWNIDVQFPAGKLIAVVGPNGAGKSTLLKAALGLVPAASGEVRFFGKTLSDVRGLVGYVPQRESVDWDFPINALEVVLMGRYGKIGWLRRPGKADYQSAEACLDAVGMRECATRQISQLSGGQQQRVFLARALAQDASLYLMDEPFSGVDAATEQAIVQVLQDMRAAGRTIIAVHHDLQTVPIYFDWVIMLNIHLITAGPISDAFTTAALQSTYGGRLVVLEEVAEEMRR
jgi:manganese/zinc/iron transport system ATP- binding protein